MSHTPLPLSELAAAMRQFGALQARFAPGVGEAFAFCAEWLEVSLQADLDKPLTLEQARRESNWSYEGLRRRLKEDPTLNAGTDGAPLIRRRDLARLGSPRGPRGKYCPRKPTSTAASETPPEAPATETSALAVESEPEAVVAPAYAVEGETVEPQSTPDEVHEAAAVAGASMAAAPDETTGETVTTAPVPRATAATRRPAPTRQRTRRHSPKERFSELLARAALG